MKKTLVDFSSTGFFSGITLDYISDTQTTKAFYKYEPTLEGFKKLLQEKPYQHLDRKLLTSVLQEQNKEALLKFPQIGKNIASLTSDKTFTVTTGHQLCIFTGPLYFIYKIVSAINLAEDLKKHYPQNDFVPVYWMASEDHDIEEVNHIHLFGKKLSWQPDLEGKNIPAGTVKTSSLQPLIEELKNLIGNTPEANELIKLFEKAYLEHKTLAEATRFLVNELFGQYGLIVLDGNDKSLKKQFIPFIKNDILANENHQLVEKTIDEFSKAGFEAQVTPRKINFFYLKDYNRQRIERLKNEAGKFQMINTSITFTEKELESEIENHPEFFSPNVVTRPLYQQVILPNLAYVGGPGEIAYWLEYKGMFEKNGVVYPLLLLRNSVLWVDKQSSEKIKKLRITNEDLFKKTDELINYWIKKNSRDIILDKEEEELSKVFKNLSEKAAQVDITLKAAVEAELQKCLNSLKHVQGKMLKAEKQKHEISINHIRKLKEKLFPEGKPQERHDNFIPFYLQNGENFIRILKENLKPFSQGLLVLSEEKEPA